MKRKILFTLVCVLAIMSANAQSYVAAPHKIISGTSQDVYDTLNVTSLSPATLNGSHGLDSVTLNLTYSYDEDLEISLIAPDGTIVQLADKLGGSDSNYIHTCFCMSTSSLIDDASAPFSGQLQPEDWLGRVNNGHSGVGKWVLHIINANISTNTGVLLNWGLYFDAHPAPVSLLTTSTLPLVVINTTNNAVIPYDEDVKVIGQMGIIYNGAGQVNHITDPYNNYNGYISIKVRGNSTRYFAQKAFSVETENANGSNNNVSLLGMPMDNDWVLYAPYDDKSMIRNVITYQMSNVMGDYAPRTRMVELVLNGDYRGVYVLMEKIKQGANRVNVTKMKATDTAGNSVTGGYIFEVDRSGTVGYDSWQSNYLSCLTAGSNIYFAYAVPKSSDIVTQQQQYIANYVNQFETALKDTSVYDTVNGYRKYIDVLSFIDQSLLQEIGHNVDGYRLSSYLHKDRGGRLAGGPIWDFNEAYGNADYNGGSDYNTFEWDLPCSLPDGNLNPFWWQKFLTDTNYVNELKCRYTQLRSGAYDTVKMNHMIDSLVGILQVPQQRHFARWPLLGNYVWPNSYVGNTWPDEINYLKGWLANRVKSMDSALINKACKVKTEINNITSPSEITMYPNPVADELHITSGTEINGLAIYNMVGQAVYTSNIKSVAFTISLKQYNSGVYTIIIYTTDGISTRKIVHVE
ncbi:MAG: CotH kinase family protein [Flavipsychrobacter sp.]|nr:CotH kinase family protein [Flavipsychrobacter sp.]